MSSIERGFTAIIYIVGRWFGYVTVPGVGRIETEYRRDMNGKLVEVEPEVVKLWDTIIIPMNCTCRWCHCLTWQQ